MNKLTEFSTHKCSLGEGIIWSPRLQCLFWLDITKKHIFQKHISSMDTKFDSCWNVDFIPSALALLENENEILVVSDVGLLKLDLKQGSFCRLVDRKSTRLNSSHQIISYAVFCLKKKNVLQI